MTETKANYEGHPNTDKGDIGDYETPTPYETTYRANYRRYLRSPEWKAIRERVLRRAGYICESCLSAGASDVHHVSYKYGYHTPAWLLRAVCRPCHDTLTAIDNGELRPWDFEKVEVHDELSY